MSKIKSSLINMFFSLTTICVVSAAILSSVNQLTSDPIALAKKEKLESAIQQVVPSFDNSPTEEMKKIATASLDTSLVYPAKMNGELVGVAIESITKNGFSGEIKILVGFDTNGNIYNYEVLEHAETPGLGDKMGTWFKEDKNQQSILGKNLQNGELKVSKDGGDVDAITASTITSRAFLEAVNQAYLIYMDYE